MNTHRNTPLRSTRKIDLMVVLFVILFLVSMIVVHMYSDSLESILIPYKIWGMGIYVVMSIVSVVFAPISTLSFLPIASAAWGSFVTALLSIFAWFVGSVIAFSLARYVGRPFLTRWISMSRVDDILARIPKTHIFWHIVFLRMVVPADVLSYALGIGTTISFSTYATASFIGILPMAFILSYAVSFPFWIGALILLFVYLFIFIYRIRHT